MADFDDSADPELGAACNRLAAFCEALPVGASIDDASGLTEPDLIRILRRLYVTRFQARIPVIRMGGAGCHDEARTPMISLPIDPAHVPDDELLVEYRATAAEANNPRKVALAAEIERRGLDV